MAAWQRWMRRAKDGCGKSGCGMVDIGYGKGGFCVNFDFIFIFFCGSSFGFRLCYWFDLILGWIFFFCGFMVVELGDVVLVVEGGGVFIMGHMWVHGGEGGGLPW